MFQFYILLSATSIIHDCVLIFLFLSIFLRDNINKHCMLLLLL